MPINAKCINYRLGLKKLFEGAKLFLRIIFEKMKSFLFCDSISHTESVKPKKSTPLRTKTDIDPFSAVVIVPQGNLIVE